MKCKKKSECVGDELDRNSFLKKRCFIERDLVHENFQLFLQHYFVVRDLDHCVKFGDSGGLLKIIEPLSVWFSGCGKHHYAKAMSNLLIDNKCVWTAHMRYVWMNNILLNLSGREGKWMGIDKVNDLVVRKVKDQYNPRGNWQSQDFFMNSISRNVFLFNNIKESVRKSAGEFDVL